MKSFLRILFAISNVLTKSLNVIVECMVTKFGTQIYRHRKLNNPLNDISDHPEHTSTLTKPNARD